MPRFQVTIDIEVQFTSGKFASNDAIADAILEEIEGGVQLSDLNVDEGEYEVTEFDVTVEHVKPVRVRRTRIATSKGPKAATNVVLEPEVKIDGEWVPNPLLADDEPVDLLDGFVSKREVQS